jgi:hypothetical protein
VVLHNSEMLEQAADGERRDTDAGLQSDCVEVVRLPAEGRAQTVEGADELLNLGPSERRFPRSVAGSHWPTTRACSD